MNEQKNETAGLVCGIISTVLGIVAFFIFGWIFGTASLILGIIALTTSSKYKGLGIAGTVLGAINIILLTILTLMVM